ncbi:MAG: 2,3-bisphosphoglycerate-independent phosphoglycerate mutase [Candidatus Komeilibacteria bacterium CG10_big_fil_rev_8_21_14_0_10_41_13]|uniref:2,3-bisphosphoglycerate-independent phosphoglycerate mutase n=1 Tax=Candidatus Komeilibacteria bacterium CG10_big_fil_rev_8_21_14_0_10_41_13 TaxID=1974476 RepID=A0A2M6WD91_9BACT|nr:MAG: 2,3-bisphosphoglycerate-independent phosphoglycerate mutase [Candidatus Komeilibacteria bacterium CG10_big_fil_rev_8_21_14_0_10_41_13]
MAGEVRPKPVVLIVLDGFGVKQSSRGNAVALAKKDNFDSFLERYPVLTLQASGEAVGLSWGEMGNSEVGHLSLGSGRIIYQSLPRITRSITDGSFFSNEAFLKACQQVNKTGGTLHIMGLMSSGGIHAYNEHCFALVEMAQKQKVKDVCIHAFLDGRDAPYDSGKKYIEQLLKKLRQIGLGRLATMSGRFYAMDRDNNWDRIEKAYQAMTLGESEKKYDDPIKALDESYQNRVYDEQFVPTVITENGQPVGTVKQGDSLIFFNFRADRARQITKAFVLPGFEKFNRPEYLKDLLFVSMTEYEKDLPLEIAYPPEYVTASLAKVISDAGLKQLHISETEKYAHVTFFFNGGREENFPGEERVIVPSPQIPAYDAKPEMSAPEVAGRIIKDIDSDAYDFIVVNFANPDMVAHTGNLKATIKSIEIVDDLVGQIVNKTLAKGGVVLITADHGNAEDLVNLQTGGIVKEHSTNPVPLYIIGEQFAGKVAAGSAGKDLSDLTPAGVLADVAPTILKIMGLKRPEEMTGRPLI